MADNTSEAAPAAAPTPVAPATTPAAPARRGLGALAIVGIVAGGLFVAGVLFGGGVLVGSHLPGGMPPGIAGAFDGDRDGDHGGPGMMGDRDGDRDGQSGPGQGQLPPLPGGPQQDGQQPPAPPAGGTDGGTSTDGSTQG